MSVITLILELVILLLVLIMLVSNYEWQRKVSDQLARIEESVQRLEDTYMAMAGRIAGDVAELKAEIAKLTEGDTARLDALADRIDTTVSQMESVDPVAPELPPEPEPVPPAEPPDDTTA